MKKLIFFSLCALLMSSSCKKDNQVIQKHTCFLMDIGGKPIVGKRVRYFNGQSSDIDFNDPNNLLQELKSDSEGKLVFNGTYNSDLGWVNLVLEPDSTHLALNSVNFSNPVDTIFFDRIVPVKLRITIRSPVYLYARAWLSTGLPPFSGQFAPKTLAFWDLKEPLKEPIDTLINIKAPSKNSFLVTTLAAVKGSDQYPYSFYSTYSALLKDSTLWIQF
jgi:hypothetical protein